MVRNSKKILTPKHFILDVDGVLTDGQFHYSIDGKVMKVFGADDADALSILKRKLIIHMISGDKRGFPITRKRIVEDMKYPLDQVSTFERIDWIKDHYDLEHTIYMGDGIYDSMVFKKVMYGIAPASGFYLTKQQADYVTKTRAAEGAVAEACVHIMEKFFGGFDLDNLDLSNGSGEWSKGEKHV